MRNDQYERLKQLQEKLTDVVIFEADPVKWPGYGIEPAAMTTEQRGNAYWSKKNAAATLSLLTKVYTITGIVERSSAPAPADDGEDDLEQEIKAAEKEAAKLLKQVQSRAYERTKK